MNQTSSHQLLIMGSPQAKRRSGIILLVVLGMLTFFSILAATYLVFSSQSRQASFVIASRNAKTPDVRALMDDALMTLIRGTADPADPFFGEDLLSDYYGRKDSLDLRVRQSNDLDNFTNYINRGFARFPIILPNMPPWNDPAQNRLDDLFTGRVITFTQGPLSARSFRVFRSRYTPVDGSRPAYHSLYIELSADLVASGVVADLTQATVRNLFYPAASGEGYMLHMNGLPRNSPGLGFNGTGIEQTIQPFLPQIPGPTGPGNPPQPFGFADLPVSLQPNRIRGLDSVNKSVLQAQGDFDESYDAADFNNWFLSYRDSNGKIIPSFHRPAVLNYILNEEGVASNFSDVRVRQQLIASLARGTFRPLPIVLTPGTSANQPGMSVNRRFTGSNEHYALRTPIDLVGLYGNPPPETAARFRLDQVAKSLIGSPDDWNPWDVDNDGSGEPDSIWVDLNLPVITSREGKLLKPLVAPRIEDLSARLNVNAHGNYEIASNASTGGVLGRAHWASSRQQFNHAANERQAFRGIGYGPAEIMIPPVGNSGAIATAAILNNFALLRSDRYQYGSREDTINPPPGRPGYDALDVLRNGWRPPLHSITAGYGYSLDPYGRSAIGLGRGGHLLMGNSGLNASTVTGGNELRDDPYEFDPTGRLSGDRPFTLDELEPLLRTNSFDLELLPRRLHRRTQLLIENHPEFVHALTTLSSSDDSPTIASLNPLSLTPQQRLATQQSILKAMEALISGAPGTLTDAQIKQLVAPELRLGRKIDVNRPFGNGVDDNNNRVIDEPGELSVEIDNQRAFAVHADSTSQVPDGFTAQRPDYGFGTGADARQLLARHLYVLMMALVRDAEFPSLDPNVPIDPAEMALYRAHRVAQWAVNVIDYRDADSIMTQFFYDPNPFDGWDVRYLDANGQQQTIGSPPAGLSPVVWGVEQPELMFSEVGAFHDVRVRNTARDSTGKRKNDPADDFLEKDLTTDQVRLPQGSLFVELYCPRSPVEATGNDQRSKQALPRELYRYADESNTTDPSTLALDLSLAAPGGMPVWRIAISSPHPDPDLLAGTPDLTAPPFADAQRDPWLLRQERPNTASFEPAQPDELIMGDPIQLDRFIWFRSFQDQAQISALTNLVPDMNPNQVFFAPAGMDTNQNARVAPGQFLMLAPRPITAFGSVQFAGVAPNRPSRHRLETNNAEGVLHFNEANVRLTPVLGNTNPAPFAPAKPLIIGTFSPVNGNWNNVFSSNASANFVGLNVSEPLPRAGNYYDRFTDPESGATSPIGPPTHRYGGNGNAQYPLNDAYVDLSTAANTALRASLDVSKDYIPRVIVEEPDPEGGASRFSYEPFLGSLPRYCSAYLQRLADPLRPYNQVTNPYRTVDWIPIDLTVFSGEEAESEINVGPSRYLARTRQRNGQVDTFRRDALFSYETNSDELMPRFAGANTYFAVGNEGHLYSSFNFLNTAYPMIGGAGPRVNPDFEGFSASIGMSGAPAQNVIGFDRNLPLVPYAQHPWLNRPFASHLELMMVPASSPARLFHEFSLPPEAGEPLVYSDQTAAANNPETLQRFYGPFRHLLNFFHGDVRIGELILHAEFSRIFDFVHTLPRFRGEVEMIAPDRIAGILNTDVAGRPRDWLLQMYSNPFNYKYNNQRQGRINLNTISEFPVWAGLMQGHMNQNEFTQLNSNGQLGFNQFLNNRRGYVPSGGAPTAFGQGPQVNYDPTRFDHRLPTEFGGVYRGQLDASFAPALRGTDTDLLRRGGVDASILRRRDVASGANPPGEVAMFVRDTQQQPIPAVGVGGDHTRNRQRDAFIRYQTAMRMPNLVSDNSQTYIVWLTLGFFEVDAATNSLGREYNEDIGQNERYQAMFVIDRSRPVGFIPGQDLNARDVVVFEKYSQ